MEKKYDDFERAGNGADMPFDQYQTEFADLCASYAKRVEELSNALNEDMRKLHDKHKDESDEEKYGFGMYVVAMPYLIKRTAVEKDGEKGYDKHIIQPLMSHNMGYTVSRAESAESLKTLYCGIAESAIRETVIDAMKNGDMKAAITRATDLVGISMVSATEIMMPSDLIKLINNENMKHKADSAVRDAAANAGVKVSDESVEEPKFIQHFDPS